VRKKKKGRQQSSTSCNRPLQTARRYEVDRSEKEKGEGGDKRKEEGITRRPFIRCPSPPYLRYLGKKKERGKRGEEKKGTEIRQRPTSSWNSSAGKNPRPEKKKRKKKKKGGKEEGKIEEHAARPIDTNSRERERKRKREGGTENVWSTYKSPFPGQVVVRTGEKKRGEEKKDDRNEDSGSVKNL